jgi:uncharacterized protein (PEP-CTERM system associated)
MQIALATVDRRAQTGLSETRRGVDLVRTPGAAWFFVVCWLVSAAAHAQSEAANKDGTPARSLTVTPTLDSSLSLVQTSGRSNGDNYVDLVTQIRPGLQVSSRSGRLRGSLLYFLDINRHTHGDSNRTLQNSLNATGSAELVQNWVYLDGRATISQQAFSPLGQQTAAGSQSSSNNQTEVGTVSLSPYLRGVVPDVAEYEARWTGTVTNVRRSITGDYTNNGISLRLNSTRSRALLGWGVEGSKTRTAFRAGRTTDEDRISLSAIVRPEPDLSLTLRAGKEAANVANIDRTSYNNWGAGLRWTPSNRSSAVVDVDKRYFGQSYRVLLEHRLPLSTFRLSATRDVSNNQTNTGGAVTLYDLLFAQYASTFPDVAVRDAFVRALLRANNVDPNTVAGGGFVAAGVSLQQRLELGWVYTTKRQTLSLQAFSGSTKAIGVVTSGSANGDDVRQSGLTATLSHRLTPTATAALAATLLHTSGNQGLGSTDLKSLNLTWNDNVSRYATATLGARYSLFDSPTDPYREAALTASLALRF